MEVNKLKLKWFRIFYCEIQGMPIIIILQPNPSKYNLNYSSSKFNLKNKFT
ncbi:unknown [Bacteroides sp. CAG:875]|nr:unknown [Bacteroides sp. CAG:875]